MPSTYLQLHTLTADEKVNVGPALATDSYLDMDAIFRAIDKTGAQAVISGIFQGTKVLRFTSILEIKTLKFGLVKEGLYLENSQKVGRR